MKLATDRAGFAWPLLGLLGSATAIGGAVLWIDGNHTVTAAGAIAFVVGAPLGLLGMAAWLNGYPYLIADVPAGTLHFVEAKSTRTSVPFDAVELAIHTKEIKSRHVTEFYDLRSPAFGDRVLFTSSDRAAVEARRDLLQMLAAQSSIRRVLETAASAQGAFRDAPALAPQLAERVPDPAQLRRALDGLARDPDAQIAAKAREVRAGLAAAA